MKSKPKSAVLDRKKHLFIKIEETREKIHNMISLDNSNMFNDEIVKLSQKLDILIVEYIKYSGGEQSGAKDHEP